MIALPAVLSVAHGAPDAAAEGEPEVMEEIVVTGMRTGERLADAVVATELIRRADIEASGARTVADVLDQHPGVQVSRDFSGAGLSLWGLDPDYILILMDGQPLIGRVDGVIDLDRIPVHDIERIEIVKGAGSTLYGADAIGGVVNIITRKAEPGVSVSAGSRVGRLGTERLGTVADTAAGGMRTLADWPLNTAQLDGSVAVGGPQVSSRTGLSAQVSPAVGPGDGATQLSGRGLATLTQTLSWQPSDQHRWDLTGMASRRLSGSTAVEDTGAVLDRTNDLEVWSLRVGPDLLFGDRARLRITGSLDHIRDQYLADQRGATALDVYQQTQETAVEGEVAATVRLGEAHVVALGTELRGESLKADRISVDEAQRQRVGAWAQDAWDLPLVLPTTVVGGLRFDRDSLFGSAWSPRVAVRHEPHPRVVLRASYGHGFRAPPFKDLYLAFSNPSAGYEVAGNPSLRPEFSRTTTVSGGWAALSDGGLDLRLALFRNDLRDMIDARLETAAADGEPARYSYANVAEAWTQGAEVGASSRPLRWLRVLGDLTLMQTRDVLEDRPLSNRAPVLATGAASLGRAGGPASVDLRASWRARTSLYSIEGERTVEETSPARTTLDGVVRWSVTPGLRLSAGVDNILDSGDPELDPTPPRWLWLGVDGQLRRPRRSP